MSEIIKKDEIVFSARKAARDGKTPNQACHFSFYTEAGVLFLREYDNEIAKINQEKLMEYMKNEKFIPMGGM